MVGRGWVYVPFQLSDLREIKNIWTAILMPRQIHSSLYLCDPTFQLTWHDIMLLLDQTLSSLEMQWVLAQATHVGYDYHLQWVPILVAPGNEEINVPTYRGTGSPLDRSTPKGAGDTARVVECFFAGIKSWVQAPVQPKEREKYIWGWGHSSVGECLSSMCKALGSIPQHC
jgi:hypothetical protein